MLTASQLATRGAALVGLVLLGLVLAFTTTGCGDDPAAPVTVSPTRHDFGEVRHGRIVNQVFTITNHSDGPVTITMAKPNCSCFQVVRQPSPRLAAGESTQFEIEFNSGSKPPQRIRGKYVQVRTDHPDAAQTTVPLEGVIFSPFYTEPRDALFFPMVTGKAEDFAPRTIKIRAEDGYEVSLEQGLENYVGGFHVKDPGVFDVTAKEVPRGVDLEGRHQAGRRRTARSVRELAQRRLEGHGPQTR